MRSKFLLLGWLLIGLTCTCGMCSKGDEAGDDDNNNGNPFAEPDPNTSWIIAASSLQAGASGFSWKATGTLHANYGAQIFSMFFQNNSDSKFTVPASYPAAVEKFSFYFKNPVAQLAEGSYTLDIDAHQGYCWLYQYTDATSTTTYRDNYTQSAVDSKFVITKLQYARDISPTLKEGYITGTFTFNLWQFTNANQNMAITTFAGKFNKIPVTY